MFNRPATILLVMTTVFATRGISADDKPAAPDLSGEWAVEWFDPKSDYRETFFIHLRQKNDVIEGSGLDPELISSVIEGTVNSHEVEFTCKPSRHPLPFKAPPFSIFRGKQTDDGAMEGSWELDRRESLFSRRQKGTWTAKRTRTDGKSTVTMTRDAKITVATTSAEYDVLCGVGSNPNQWERDTKESRRRGESYEVAMSASELLVRYAIDKQIADLGNDDPVRKKLCGKIEAALHREGYPWKLDKDSRTLVELASEKSDE